MDNKKNPEIENLNIDDLDVEELERRLELASAGADVAEPSDCTVNCYIFG